MHAPRKIKLALMFLMFAGVLAGCRRPSEAQAPSAPNVLMICIDVLRADHVGAFGYERSTTPWIDRLVRSGVRFDGVMSAASWTKPSVPSYFTGRFPHQHGVYEGSRSEGGKLVSDVLPEDETTIAEVFSQSDYRTVGFVNNAQIDGVLGFGQGFDLYDDECGDAADIRDRFVTWLDAEKKNGEGEDDPFFAYLHFLDVHWPYAPEDPFRDVFDPAQTSIDFFTPAWKTLKRNIREGAIELAENDRQAMVDLYDSELRYTDREIGAVVEALRARGVLENTVIVFLSDHGEEFLDHGGIGHGNGLHRELLNVPLVIRFPDGRHAGRSIDAPASLVDVLPTVADACGIEPPQNVAGLSLLGALKGGDHADRADRAVYSEGIHGDRYQQTIVQGRWKYISTVFLGSDDDDDENDVPDAREKLTPGTCVEVEGIVSGGGVFLAEEVIVQDVQDDDRDKVTATIERIADDRSELHVLGFRVPLSEDLKVEDPDGERIPASDLREGDLVKFYGHAEDEKTLMPVKAKVRGSERRKKTKLEGPIAGEIRREGKTLVLRLCAREVRIDGGTEVMTQEWARVLDKRKSLAAEQSKAPAATASRDPLAVAMELGIPVEHELYDLLADPGERIDLAAAEPGRVEAMGRLLNGLRIPSVRRRSGQVLESDDEARLRAMGYIK